MKMFIMKILTSIENFYSSLKLDNISEKIMIKH